MTMRRALTILAITIITAGGGLGAAAPASAGGIGDLLSPAFGTSCANRNTGARLGGIADQATGAAGGNTAGLPIGSPLNQCGGADLISVINDRDDGGMVNIGNSYAK